MECYNSVSSDIPLQLSDLSWPAHFLHAAEESEGVCKLDLAIHSLASLI